MAISTVATKPRLDLKRPAIAHTEDVARRPSTSSHSVVLNASASCGGEAGRTPSPISAFNFCQSNRKRKNMMRRRDISSPILCLVVLCQCN
eukprot:3543411-Amphidinium_carterae.1